MLTLEKDGQTVTLVCDNIEKSMIYKEKNIDLLAERNNNVQARGIEALPADLDIQTLIALNITLYNELTMPDIERVQVDFDPNMPLRCAEDGQPFQYV